MIYLRRLLTAWLILAAAPVIATAQEPHTPIFPDGTVCDILPEICKPPTDG